MPDATSAPLNQTEMLPRLRTHDILENVSDAFVALDDGWRILYANREACRINQKPAEEFVGKVHWEEWPGAVGTNLERQLRRAMTERVVVHFEHRYVSEPYDVWIEVDAYPSEDGINLFYRDITRRKQAEEALRRSQEGLSFAIDAARLGTFYCDWPLDKIVWNDICKDHFFLPPDAKVDFTLFYSLLHPDDREPTRAAIERAFMERVAYDVEYRTLAPDGRTRWVNAVGRFYYDGEGNPLRFDGITRDISERKAAEEEMRRRAARERFLAELAERARGLTDPDAVVADAVHSVGRFLGVARCVFADIDITADACTVLPDYCADDTVASIAGTFAISTFGPALVNAYQAGGTVIVNDILQDTGQVPAAYRAAYEAIACRAFVAVPVLHSSRLVSVLAVHSAAPRQWTPEDVELLQSVVERTWLTVQVTRQNRALARGAEALRARAERETLLNRIGEALRASADPEVVQETAVGLLGEALQADRCYLAFYDLSGGDIRVSHDWHRPGLPSIQGTYPFTNTAQMYRELYQQSNTSVISDAHAASLSPQTRANMEGLHLRSRVSVAFVDGEGLTATLTAAMSGVPRDWTDEEVTLVEAVATQLRVGVEAARVQQREHRIAVQLQDALQPPIPERIPGLSVGRFTKPALDEAQIGGDFYDLFPLDKDVYACVIGDVSGKGLAAAQQLALIRNSLRTTLYLYREPAQAATALNQIVTAHNLLIGFVTVFVAVYDVGTGQFTYCSCGHEPGIIRRRDGAAETLETLGLPVGVSENANYCASNSTLLAGDTLLLYTDGVSEAGPSRREMLGTEGLTRLFGSLPANADVQTEAETLVAQVSDFTNGVFRDDVAVLLARRL